MKIADYADTDLKAKKVAVVWIKNDYGKGGRDIFIDQMKKRGIEVVIDQSTEPGQVDYAVDALKVKNSGADVVFVYLTYEESARFLVEARRQKITQPLVGETSLLGQIVVNLAGEAANGVRVCFGLSPDAPLEPVKAFKEADTRNTILPLTSRRWAVYRRQCDQGCDGEGRQVRQRGSRQGDAWHNRCRSASRVLMTTSWDKNGDVERDTFIGELVDGKTRIIRTLPAAK